ncbi:MAG TPA: phosphatidylinositol mannoside acyltransferase [Acidimicrobiales bacterium]|nr:phosphatidylinositol mannoside acyltransferase [Acidimicrobiales bacterium]
MLSISGPGRPSTALLAMRLGRSAATHLPAPMARGVAEGAAVLISRQPHLPGRGSWAERRRLVGRHLTRVLGSRPDRATLGRLVDQTFASYARYWAESLRLPALSTGEIAAGIRYENFGYIEQSEAAGRGTILALPHLGGWEWAGTHLALTGHKMSVVVERLEPPDLFDWFVGFREQLGMQVIPAGPDAATRCRAALADNHVLCLLSDRLLPGTSGVDVEFFAERTGLPAGPAMLALRTGATLLPAAVYFEPATDAHHGLVLPPIDTTRTDGLREDVQRVTQDLARAFETLVIRAPTQWHLMQPNWPSDLGPPGSPGERSSL